VALILLTYPTKILVPLSPHKTLENAMRMALLKFWADMMLQMLEAARL
jgi:hypothetical protein